MKTDIACYLGLDIGGTGVKAGVIDADGKLLGFAQRGYTPEKAAAPIGNQFPIDVLERAARETVRAAVKSVASPIRAMAISSQGQTFVALDEHDRPLHPAIMWYDSRAAKQADKLQVALQPFSDDPQCPRFGPMATVAKIVWFHENVPAVRERAERYLLLPDYFAHRLCGRAVSDPNTAASGGFSTSGAQTYFTPLLKAAGLTENQLATIQPSGSPIAPLHGGTAADWGLSPETILVTGTNDQYAGALGAGNCRPGICTVATGTCLAMVTLTERPPPAGLHGGVFPLPPYHFVLAYTKTAGIVLDWFRREFASSHSPAEMDRLADSVPIGCSGLTALPHFDGICSPDPNPHARGIFSGLTLQHGRNSMYRALMESIAFCLRGHLEFLHDKGLKLNTIRAIGGGAKSRIWLQMQADAAAVPIEQPMVTEAAVMGAAMLAAHGCGDFASLQECSRKMYRTAELFTPRPENRRAYDNAYRAYVKLLQQAKLHAAVPG